MSHWVDLSSGFELLRANYVVCVLYSRKQLLMEFEKKQVMDENTNSPFYISEYVTYRIMAIIKTVLSLVDPTVLITPMRNALKLSKSENEQRLTI